MGKEEKHLQLLQLLHEIYKKKNTDYGDSFSRTFKSLGIVSAVTRIVDKVNRLERLARNTNQVNDESIDDTLLDNANYSVMTIMEKTDEEFELFIKNTKLKFNVK